MNPYAKELGDRDPVAVLTETPVRIRAEIARIGAEAFTRTYAEGKWNIAQIMTHLVHEKLSFLILEIFRIHARVMRMQFLPRRLEGELPVDFDLFLGALFD
jgi:hypothetical protein